MKKVSGKVLLFFYLMFFLFCLPLSSSADLDWRVTRQFSLKASPLDLAQSGDGKMLFILSPGEILVYSEDKLVSSIPVEKEFDRLFYSEQDKSLIITSSSKRSLKAIQLEVLHKFDISGLPFKGAKDAPVLIAVFSDYQ